MRLPLLSPAPRRFVRLAGRGRGRARFVARHLPFGPLGRAAYALARLAGTPMFFGVHHMQLFDAASARAVLAAGGARLAPGGAPPDGALVDVGAGPGCVTAPLAASPLHGRDGGVRAVLRAARAPRVRGRARRRLGPAVAPAVRAALGGAAAGAGAPRAPPPPSRAQRA